jgi:hypothetical protein
VGLGLGAGRAETEFTLELDTIDEVLTLQSSQGSLVEVSETSVPDLGCVLACDDVGCRGGT